MKSKGSVLIILCLLLLLLASFFIPSLKMKSSENRTMATFNMIFNPEIDSVVYHDSPVERLEAALSDQFPFREFFVKKYLWIFNKSENWATSWAKKLKLEKPSFMLHAVGSYELIGNTGYITVYPSSEPMNKSLVKRHVDQIRFLHDKYPGLKFYVYYVSQAFDTPWFEKYVGAQFVDHYQQILDAIPDYVRSSHLVYKDLDDYMNMHYKTDHHWNHKGSRKGYEDIYLMMSKDINMGEIRVPEAEIMSSKMNGFVYLGSYAKALGELYNGSDEFSFYEYNLPERKLAILNVDSLEETEAVKIGLFDEYRVGKINKKANIDHYINMYGTARDVNGNSMVEKGLYIIRNSKGNGKNLVICGDSNNRAMRDVLASHFDTTVYFDYRLLSKIPIDYIIERYAIDVLLISSHTSMWNSEEYFFTFRRDE